MSTVVDDGPAGFRDSRTTTNYARGLRPVDATTPGAIPFAHPNGSTLYGAFHRPGVDVADAHTPNSGFGLTNLRNDTDLEDLNASVATNGDNNEQFDQNGVQFDLTWDINDNMTLKYLGGWSDFDYTFDIDLDATNNSMKQDQGVCRHFRRECVGNRKKLHRTQQP